METDVKSEHEMMDKIIKETIIINPSNLEYCAKNNIINGLLLQGIRDAMRKYATIITHGDNSDKVKKDCTTCRESDVPYPWRVCDPCIDFGLWQPKKH